jgi:hypothetical protein
MAPWERTCLEVTNFGVDLPVGRVMAHNKSVTRNRTPQTSHTRSMTIEWDGPEAQEEGCFTRGKIWPRVLFFRTIRIRRDKSKTPQSSCFTNRPIDSAAVRASSKQRHEMRWTNCHRCALPLQPKKLNAVTAF